MKPIFKCELNYFPSPHLYQLYDGFEKLRKIGIINISIKPDSSDQTKPLLKVVVDNKYKVIYDTLDGLNWINGSIEDNLNHFKNNVKADFYFKRSYNKLVFDHAPLNCKVYPLGLNVPFKPEGKSFNNIKDTLKDLLQNNSVFSKYFNKTSFSSTDLEYYPIPCKVNKVLFLARLWDPEEVTLEHLIVEREIINKNRIDCITACRKEFGKQFFGGLQSDSFSAKQCKDLLMPLSITRRDHFLNIIKDHNICIATTGLHDSIGWKFAEYVASSRAIVSEPLKYELPGNFNHMNYLEYNDKYELLDRIQTLLKDKGLLFEMMNNNFHYYNNYLRPDKLILNTLIKIKQYE